MNAAQVRSKARLAMKRRAEEIEQEEIEGGEINLIPYLDIVTNLMLFLLASISSGLILGQLNTTLPDQGPPQSAMKQSDPNQDPNQKPLQLIVAVTKSELYVTSRTGLEGGEPGRPFVNPRAKIPRGPDVGDKHPIPSFDYRRLNDALVEIAARRWKNRKRLLPTFQVFLVVDNEIPYGTIVAVMDALRCKLPAEEAAQVCLFPSDEEAIKSAPEPEDMLSNIYDPERVSYDPERHALFHDIIFSRL
ncbi:MAG: biopolymer transporter ExbD [Proteobacteria bacterium]|nr:biopolymer transporter ExbD [Pseudomonadota bacterium]